MDLPLDMDRPFCPVSGCKRLCQLASTPGKGAGKNQYLKTCNRHNINDIVINKPIMKTNFK